MKSYSDLFKRRKGQNSNSFFAHFYPISEDYDRPFKEIAEKTSDGQAAWEFQQPRFKKEYSEIAVPKLKNYLNYTFVRLNFLERQEPTNNYFCYSNNNDYVSFNTGLQDSFDGDLLLVFQRYKPKAEEDSKPKSEWIYKFCCTPTEGRYRKLFGIQIPKLAWYSEDSRDFIFDTSYTLDKDVFLHLFERAKERSGMPNATDEVVKNYLRGVIENLVPKIRRNYKIAIPVYYVEDKRMQLLLPFVPAWGDETSCFLIDRDDKLKTYRLKTIFDLDQAYFSARLITRPDKDWLNP